MGQRASRTVVEESPVNTVALLVTVLAMLGSIVVAVLTLRAMARDDEELSRFVAFTRVPLRD